MTNTSIFVGCSFTNGDGLVGEKNSPNLWVNQLHQSAEQLKSTTVINLGISGNDNSTIFQNAIDACIALPTYLFVSWTSFPRIKINPGVETYVTKQLWHPNSKVTEIVLHKNLTYSKKYLTELKHKFFDLVHDHYEILKILEYSATIKKLASLTNTKVFFTNAILPWDTDYFVKKEKTSPTDTTEYTRQILFAETRSDDEFWILYDKIHNDYFNAGYPGKEWLNVYNGFKKHFMLDIGSDGIHPGPDSHRAFSKFLVEKIRI